MPRQKYQNEGLIPRLFAGLRHTTGARPGGSGGPHGRPPRLAHHLGQPHGWRQRVRGRQGLTLPFFVCYAIVCK